MKVRLFSSNPKCFKMMLGVSTLLTGLEHFRTNKSKLIPLDFEQFFLKKKGYKVIIEIRIEIFVNNPITKQLRFRGQEKVSPLLVRGEEGEVLKGLKVKFVTLCCFFIKNKILH